MNCGIFTSIALIIVAALGFLGISQQATVETFAPPAVVVEAPPADLLCDQYPVYCVPLVGGGDEVVFGRSETPASREMALAAEMDVVRGITGDGSYFIGNPNAPIRFKVFHNFGCSHCRDFHNGDLGQFLTDYVATGQAMLESDLMDFGSPPYPTHAAYAALCAGEQGAYWEMQDVLYKNPAPIALDNILGLAEGTGLQGGALRECIESGRYEAVISLQEVLSADLGVTGTPMVFVSYGDGVWSMTDRGYANLSALTDAANGR